MEFYAIIDKNEIMTFTGKMDGARNHYVNEKSKCKRHIIICFPYEKFRFKILHIYTYICVYVHVCEQVYICV